MDGLAEVLVSPGIAHLLAAPLAQLLWRFWRRHDNGVLLIQAMFRQVMVLQGLCRLEALGAKLALSPWRLVPFHVRGSAAKNKETSIKTEADASSLARICGLKHKLSKPNLT